MRRVIGGEDLQVVFALHVPQEKQIAVHDYYADLNHRSQVAKDWLQSVHVGGSVIFDDIIYAESPTQVDKVTRLSGYKRCLLPSYRL